MHLVRVRTPSRHEKLGSRPPGTLVMGKTATADIAGLINGAPSADGDSMTPAYYIRVENHPAVVLIYEEWLKEA